MAELRDFEAAKSACLECLKASKDLAGFLRLGCGSKFMASTTRDKGVDSFETLHDALNVSLDALRSVEKELPLIGGDIPEVAGISGVSWHHAAYNLAAYLFWETYRPVNIPVLKPGITAPNDGEEFDPNSVEPHPERLANPPHVIDRQWVTERWPHICNGQDAALLKAIEFLTNRPAAGIEREFIFASAGAAKGSNDATAIGTKAITSGNTFRVLFTGEVPRDVKEMAQLLADNPTMSQRSASEKAAEKCPPSRPGGIRERFRRLFAERGAIRFDPPTRLPVATATP